MFGVKFVKTVDSDSESSGDEFETPAVLHRVTKCTGLKDILRDRSQRLKEQEERKNKNEGSGLELEKYVLESQTDTEPEDSPLSSEDEGQGRGRKKKKILAIKGPADEESVKTLVEKRKTRKRKQQMNDKASSSKTKKKGTSVPKSYAANIEDPTRIPENLAQTIPSIDWEDTFKKTEEGLPTNTLSSKILEQTGVMGRGKGTEKGLPKYEHDSLWQYMIPSADAKDPEPWKKDPATVPDDVKLKFISVVSCISLGINLDLDYIAQKCRDLHYTPDTFSPLVMRLKNPHATVMLFKVGKMVVTGTKSEKDNEIVVNEVVQRLRNIGVPVRPLFVQIQNILATCNLGFRIRVHLLAQLRGVSTEYHPEFFTGVTVCFAIPRAKAILFRTGSVLITGVKTEEDAANILKKVYPLAKLYAN